MNFIIFVIFSMLSTALGMHMEKLDDSSMYSPENHKITKREASASKGAAQYSTKQKDFYDFVEDKLVQHSQALEHLVKLVTEAVGAINNLAENLGGNIEEPKLPEKIEVELEKQERSGGDANESRRSYWGKSFKWPSLFKSKPASSAWCSVALLCHRTRSPVCGYDDSFGYGKFDDLCHLIQVNCYWNYNFALVPTCRSFF